MLERKTEEAAPLELALEQSQGVKEKVEECADDIGAANALVKARIAEGATTLPADRTLATSIDLEDKVQGCADDLHQVNDTLAQGIDDLRQTEAALVASKKDLAETQVALAAAIEGEKNARFQALHDVATGLANRSLFDTRLEQAIQMAARHRWSLAVMFFDIDRFKGVNDTHGHAADDAVLLEVANRLSGDARGEDTVCRNGGDEFLYLLVDPQSRSNVEQIARKVANRVEQEIAWKGALLKVAASIGVAIYPDDGTTGEDLIRSADAAMHLAKKRRSVFAFAERIISTEAA